MTITLEMFRNEKDTKEYAEGDIIFREGEPGDAMYVVVEGRVALTVRGRAVESVGPGGVLGEMALVDRAPRTATATAQLPARLAVIPEKRFLYMVQQTPHFSLQILRVVVERLRRMDEKL